MAKVGMRHRENFNEIVGNLSRDAVQLSHPNRMAVLAMNNKKFSDGLENHLKQQQPTQNPMQQVYASPPPETAPYVPTGQAAASSAAADGPPSWMGIGAARLGRLGMGAASLGGSALAGMAHSGVAVARTISSTLQAEHAARQAIRDDDFDFRTDGGDFESIAGASDSMAIDDALHGSQRHDMRMQIHDQDMADAKAKNQRDAIAMVENTHQKNSFDDGGVTISLIGSLWVKTPHHLR